MADFLNVYDMDRQKTAILQNAFDITETQELNKIYTLDFQIPADDEKTKYLLPFHYVRWGENGQLYRIININYVDSDKSILSVSCEHVIAMLCDELMFGAIQYGGGTVKTSAVITYLLSKQSTANWVLDECDFDRRFEYLWEQENILNALYAIPKEFTKAYKWQFDTTVYPWKLSLKAIDATIHPEYYIRAKRNLLSSGTAQDYTGICTRIYPLGYGEGVNQLTIKDMNNGVPYLQSPANIVAQYGIKEKVLVDRRFENAESLKEYAQTMLDGLQTPSMSRTFDVVDLYPLTSQDIDDAEVGKICKMTGDDTIAYITKTTRVLDVAGNLSIELSTKATDIASTIADLADRVRIESVYAQGATQLYQHSKDANATTTKGSVLNLYFPEEMRQINKVLLKVQLEKFRSYSQTTESNGGFSQTYTISDSSKEITSQTNTENKELTVSESSQTYSVDASERTYSVSESSQTYSVDASDKTVTATYNATKTTNMTADSNANITTTQDGGGTTSSSGGTSVTVSGGSASGNSTDVMTNGLSLSVDASGTVSAPMATQTSAPNTDVTSGTIWPESDHGTITTEGTPNGAVSVNLGDSNGKIYGETYNVYSANDGYHSHEHKYEHGEYATIDGGGHHHSVMVDIPTGIFEVRNNLYSGDNQKYHAHNIAKNSLSHSHNINHYHTVSVSGSASGGQHTHTFSIPNHTHTISAHSHKINIAHQHEYNLSHSHTITIPGHSHTIKIPGHSHTITIPGHSHTIKIPGHKHTFACPSHKHTITIPGHSHTITIPSHSHDITPGIFESGNATAFDIYVNGTKKTTITSKTYEGDITAWLLNDQNQVPRDSWIKVEIRPNDLAYVVSSVFVQGFVQSRGGGNY